MSEPSVEVVVATDTPEENAAAAAADAVGTTAAAVAHAVADAIPQSNDYGPEIAALRSELGELRSRIESVEGTAVAALVVAEVAAEEADATAEAETEALPESEPEMKAPDKVEEIPPTEEEKSKKYSGYGSGSIYGGRK